MKKLTFISIILLLLIWLEPTLARTYRWVDENGVTIYSQSPPPSGKATIIKAPPPAPATAPGETMKKLKARLDAIEEAKKKKNEPKDKENKEADRKEVKKENCQSATENLKTLEQHARIRMKMDDGSYRMLPEEERQAQIEKAKNAMRKASEIILDGLRIKTDEFIVRYPERYYDERGKKMWDIVWHVIHR